MNPGKKNSNLLKNTGIHFLEFALGFLSLAKCHYQPSHDMKVNSLPFFALDRARQLGRSGLYHV